MKKTLIIALLVSFASSMTFTQTIEEREAKVRNWFEVIKTVEDTQEKTIIADSIQREMIEILYQAEDFDFQFSLDNIGSVVSEDGVIHMYSWNIPLKDGTSQYYALIQHGEMGTMYTLAQGIPYIPNVTGNLNEMNWYGGFYYKLINCRYRDKTIYVALGWIPGDNEETQYKVIDVLTFSKTAIKFGNPIFKLLTNKRKQSRVLFEYDINAQMNLDYDKKKKRILFDHLTPIRELKDGTQIYAPDESVDALVYKKELWNHVENVKVKNPR